MSGTAEPFNQIFDSTMAYNATTDKEGVAPGVFALINDARFGVPVFVTSVSGTAQTINFPTIGRATYRLTKTANVALTISGGATGQDVELKLVILPGTGTFTESFTNTNIQWPAGVPPSPSQTATNVYVLSTSDNGTTIQASFFQ